jgi:large subunit ribosomal protein L32e
MTVEEEKVGSEEATAVVRPPELSVDERNLLMIRRVQKSKKPKFRRQESWRYKRVHPNWRRPKGIDSKMRRKLGGRPKLVEIGYGSPHRIRGRSGSGHDEVLVFNVGDLSKVAHDQVVRIGHVVGQRKRLDIVEKAKALGLYVVNPGRGVETES